MTPDERTDFAKTIIEAMGEAHKQESPINPQNIFYALGVSAVAYVGWSFSSTQETNSEKLDDLTEAVAALVTVSEAQQLEISRRGDWMGEVNTYSEQSRRKDDEHDRNYEELNRRLLTLETGI